MIELVVLSPWVVETIDGEEYREARVKRKYACAFEDMSATPAHHVPPTINMLVARVVCDAATADLIAADAELKVLSRIDLDARETHQSKTPTKSDKQSMSSYLAAAGASKAVVDVVFRVDEAADGKAIVDAATAFCRALTKQSI